jgi:hypothetical protein
LERRRVGNRIKGKNKMEFRLLYEGELLPSANQCRPSEKHAIRRSFHPQLRRLWSAEENLRELAKRRCGGDDGDPTSRESAPKAHN